MKIYMSDFPLGSTLANINPTSKKDITDTDRRISLFLSIIFSLLDYMNKKTAPRE